MMSAETLVAILGGLFVIAATLLGAIYWLFNLEFKNNKNSDSIALLFKSVDDMEKTMLRGADETRKSLLDLTVQVARMMERLEHANKKVLDLTAKELQNLFDKGN